MKADQDFNEAKGHYFIFSLYEQIINQKCR